MRFNPDGHYRTKDEAVVAALDAMEEGDTLTVHEQLCTMAGGTCTCVPQRWEY